MAKKRKLLLPLVFAGLMGFVTIGCGDKTTEAPISEDEIEDLGPPDVETGDDSSTTNE
jgi:hypothetical protein